MYFVSWLLKRASKRMFNDWEWIRKYREFIIDEKAVSIVLTVLLGALWFIVMSVIAVWISDGRPPQYVLYVILSVPPLFYIYNWLVALYEIYDRERMATWEELKR